MRLALIPAAGFAVPGEREAVFTQQALTSPVSSTLLLNSPSSQLCVGLCSGPLSGKMSQRRFLFSITI